MKRMAIKAPGQEMKLKKASCPGAFPVIGVCILILPFSGIVIIGYNMEEGKRVLLEELIKI